MKAVFADTSYYAAVLSPRDAAHEASVRWSQSSFGQVITTEFVLVELGNALSATPRREAYPAFVAFLQDDPDTVVIQASGDLFRAGLDLYARRPDKQRSVTDCISFVVMKQHGVTEALTADHHFEQAGFTALLR